MGTDSSAFRLPFCTVGDSSNPYEKEHEFIEQAFKKKRDKKTKS